MLLKAVLTDCLFFLLDIRQKSVKLLSANYNYDQLLSLFISDLVFLVFILLFNLIFSFMKPNESFSAGINAAEWQERQKHEDVMAKIAQVKGYYEVDYGDAVYGGGPYMTWRENKLSLDELWQIMNRSQPDEIMALIHRYNHAVSEDNQRNGQHLPYFSLPEEIQEEIAFRGVQEEIDAYLEVQGFGAKGQNVILDRENHDEIMNYVSKHGLLLEQQRKLLARGDEDEIQLHISRHGLAKEILDEMLDNVEKTEDCTFFYKFIALHELPVEQQKRMLCVVPDGAILDYFNKYGLWNEAHITLLLHCHKEVIKIYFEKHHYLCPEAEDVLATLRVREVREELIDAYIRFWKDGSGHFLPQDHFLPALLKEPEANRDAIAQVLLKMPYSPYFIREDVEQDIELVKNGSDEALQARIDEGRPMHIRAFSELFFERDSKFFVDYMEKCAKVDCYLF